MREQAIREDRDRLQAEEAASQVRLGTIREEIEKDRQELDERLKLMKQKATELFQATEM